MNKYLKYLCYFMAVVAHTFAIAQVSYKNGELFMHDYSDEELAREQVWAVLQDDRHVMYFGTTSGILEFDGKRWKQIHLSNNSGVRSLDKDSSGIVYVGATGEFGYLASDSTGQIGYYSLKSKLDSAHQIFTDVWWVNATSTGVYFVTRKWIFRWHKEQLSVIKTNLEELYGLATNEKMFVLQIDSGFYEVNEDTTIYLPFSKLMEPRNGLFNFLPYKDNKLLLVNEQQFYVYNYDLVEHYSANYAEDIDSSLFINALPVDFLPYLKENKIYSTLAIHDDLYAIGTIRNGIIFFNSKGEFLDIVNKESGLVDNTILSMYVDCFGDLWVGTNNGIVRIEINYPLTVFNDMNGLEGSVLSSIEHNGIRYAGTIYGVFRPEAYTKNGLNDIRYISISPKKESAWCFFTIDDVLLTSGTFAVEKVTPEKTIPVIETGSVFSFGATHKFPNTVFLGMLDSFGYFQFRKNKKGEIHFHNYNKIDGIHETIRKIALDSIGDIWATSEYNGIYHIQFYENKLDSLMITNYDTVDGLPQMDFNYVYNINRKILIGTSSGLYTLKLNDNENHKKYSIIPDTTYGGIFIAEDNSIGDVAQDNEGNIWINSHYGIGPLKKINGKYIWDTIPYQRINCYELQFDKHNNLWANYSDGLYKFRPSQEYSYGKSFNSLIRKVILGKDSVLFAGSYYSQNDFVEKDHFIVSSKQPLELKPEIEYRYNSISFTYASAYYIDPDNLWYKYKLKEFDNDWSEWTKETRKEYTNLPEGSYTFIVKAKNVYGNISNEAMYSFRVLPPWYRTIYAYLGYLIVIAVLFYLAIFLNSRRLRAANLKLERIVQQRTHEIEKQKEDILERNREISRQKEEIAEQARQLEQTNIELEKLSIVASKTDNAVVIMDEKGKFQWINDGFTRMYGYTLDELIKHRGDNIYDTSGNTYVKELIDRCISEKKTVIYESMVIPHEGDNIWAQTTLTPILDEKGNVSKLIAIDTDIGQLKTAEIEISNQKEELQAQSEMLADINEELERNNMLITDSISYAKRIQEAILPTESVIKKYFPESFIYFKPKDIVSGDFFWFLQPSTDEWGKATNKLFLAAVDCTGHGVPGAFMSMIGNTLLNDIVGNDKIFKPSEILDKLNTGIIELLKQRTKGDESQDDGMDITVCKIDPDLGELEIAMANHTAYISDNGQLISIEGDIFSIGGFFAKRFKPKFTQQVFDISEDTVLYMFSDGFKDQFGGPDRQKFIETRFKKMLEDNMQKSMKEQYQIIDRTFQDWKGENRQIDDVMVLGIRFSNLEDLY